VSTISLKDATAKLDRRLLRDIGIAEDGSIEESNPHLRRLKRQGTKVDRLLAVLSLSGTMLLNT